MLKIIITTVALVATTPAFACYRDAFGNAVCNGSTVQGGAQDMFGRPYPLDNGPNNNNWQSSRPQNYYGNGFYGNGYSKRW
jgi:hypothetical protein